MENRLTLTELKKALSSMRDNKTPGIDGLPKEYYSTFWDEIGPVLVEVFEGSSVGCIASIDERGSDLPPV